jgi:hypothetical protein
MARIANGTTGWEAPQPRQAKTFATKPTGKTLQFLEMYAPGFFGRYCRRLCAGSFAHLHCKAAAWDHVVSISSCRNVSIRLEIDTLATTGRRHRTTAGCTLLVLVPVGLIQQVHNFQPSGLFTRLYSNFNSCKTQCKCKCRGVSAR